MAWSCQNAGPCHIPQLPLAETQQWLAAFDNIKPPRPFDSPAVYVVAVCNNPGDVEIGQLIRLHYLTFSALHCSQVRFVAITNVDEMAIERPLNLQQVVPHYLVLGRQQEYVTNFGCMAGVQGRRNFIYTALFINGEMAAGYDHAWTNTELHEVRARITAFCQKQTAPKKP